MNHPAKSIRTIVFSLAFFSLIPCGMGREKPKEEKDAPKWTSMFDGETLDHWSVPGIGGEGPVDVKDGAIRIGMGAGATGIRYDEDFPKINYEIRYEAMRNQGYDFFAALTFPVEDSHCTFINGGWGGGTTGLSCIEGFDASENATSQYFKFDRKYWYEFRVRVVEGKISVWIKELKTPEQIEREKKANAKKTETTPLRKERDPEQPVIDHVYVGERISLRSESNDFKPLGIATWTTEGYIRKIEYRNLDKEEIQKSKKEIEEYVKRNHKP